MTRCKKKIKHANTSHCNNKQTSILLKEIHRNSELLQLLQTLLAPRWMTGSEPKMSGRCRRGSPGQKLFLALRQACDALKTQSTEHQLRVEICWKLVGFGKLHSCKMVQRCAKCWSVDTSADRDCESLAAKLTRSRQLKWVRFILYYQFFCSAENFFAPMLDIRAGRIADVRWMQMVRVPCRQCEAYLSRSVGNLVVPKLMQAGPVGEFPWWKGTCAIWHDIVIK